MCKTNVEMPTNKLPERRIYKETISMHSHSSGNKQQLVRKSMENSIGKHH
jgi:hypothetical protein